MLGNINFQHVALEVVDDPGQKLVTFNASAQDHNRIMDLIAAYEA